MRNSVINYLAGCWALGKNMMNGSYSYCFMARHFIKVKHLRETKHPQISNGHLFWATFLLWNSSSLKWFGFPLKLTIMRFGLHQRKAINDLIVRSNGLFSVMFLFISSVAWDAIDYSYLHSFIWIPQQRFLLVLLCFKLLSWIRVLKGTFLCFLISSSVKTSLKFTRQIQHSSASHYSITRGHAPIFQVLGSQGQRDCSDRNSQCSMYWILLLSEHIWGDVFQLCAGDGARRIVLILRCECSSWDEAFKS